MKTPLKTGLSFGITSGVITTLGLIMGLYSSTNSRIAIIGGVVAIAITDCFSDALGIHISQETQNKNKKDVWQTTLATFFSKLIIASSFIFFFLLFDLPLSVWLSIGWGVMLLSIPSLLFSKEKGVQLIKPIFEHITIALIVILITSYLGTFIASFFN